MRWVFWASVLAILYTYAGYPFWLWVRSQWRPSPVRKAPIVPSVSIIMAVHNEERVLSQKLHNLFALHYLEDRLEIIVVSDGSTDETNKILTAQKHPSLRVILRPRHEGKAPALNQAIQRARGEIVIFTDARQRIEPEALNWLAADFSDPIVGCVSGELMLGNPDTGTALEGVGLYWRIEKKIREWESAAGSMVGATGGLYAVRRKLLVPLPSNTILDDVYIPLHVARQGYRVVFEPHARAWDSMPTSPKHEFRRKVRTLTGNYQLLQLAPWLLSRSNPVRFEFVSHKMLRLLAPLALAATFLSALFLQGGVYSVALGVQLAFYILGALAGVDLRIGFLERLSSAVFAFILMNTAAIVALVKFLSRKQVWIR